MDKVSIVLPTYNGEKYLRQSIESCLNQTYHEIELVIVVDGSTDSSKEIINEYEKDSRLVVLYTKNQGLPSALNIGFGVASGGYWTWTSDDNLFKPDAIAVMKKYLEDHACCPMVCTDFDKIDDTGRIVGHDRRSWACFLYRAEAARQTGLYLPEFRLVEDVNYFLRLQYVCGPIERIPVSHYLYRIHSGSLSARQIGKRHFVSAVMHYDLYKKGISTFTIDQIFRSAIQQIALVGDAEHLKKIAEYIISERINISFKPARIASFYSTVLGRLITRLTLKCRAAYRRIYRWQGVARQQQV